MPTTARLLTSDPLREGARRLAADWTGSYLLTGSDWWWNFEPLVDRPFRRQGWKVHVSAVPATATKTMRLVAGVVMPRGLRWKVIKTIGRLTAQGTPPAPVTQVGKFITVYLEDESSVAEVAEELHAVTDFYDGPVVPSDHRYRRGSNVYLRYGGFSTPMTYGTPDQIRTAILVDPDGGQSGDRRAPGEVAPPWMTDLPVPAEPSPARSGSGLFGRDIHVVAGLRQSARGGVYRAMWNGEQVIVKEARIGTCVDLLGRDARTRLLNEWKVLQRLKGTGLAPEPLDFFVEEDNAYLVEEFIPGDTLRKVVESSNYHGDPDPDELLSIWRKLPGLVAEVGAHGVSMRDLSPNNILVDGERCVFIDLELSILPEWAEPPFGGWTPGYARDNDDGRSPEDALELALSGIAHFILTGIDPYLGASQSYAPHVDGVLAEYGPRAADFERVRSRLGAGASAVDRDRILAEAVATGEDLVRRTEWDRGPWPWQEKWAPGALHPASFASGTLGIVRFYLDLWHSSHDSVWIRHAGELLAWTYDKAPFVPGQTPVGLHMGVGSMPWLMAEIATIDDQQSALWRDRAIELAAEFAAVKLDFSDITHGLPGIGLTQLAVLNLTGDEGCREAARRIAHELVRDATDQDGLPAWPRGDYGYFGFAHGTAGVAYFLHSAGLMLPDAAADELAAVAGRALAAAAEPTHGGHGVTWPLWPGSTTLWTHWCNGAAGVGAFLLPSWSVTGDEAVLDAAVKAGRTITHGRSFGTCCRCHGLAGDGDYLLDLAAYTGGEEFRAGAVRIGRKLDALKIMQGTAAVWPHEGDGLPRPGFLRGYTGIHSFMLRLAGLLDQSPLMLPRSIERKIP
ncbi:lanthionine synthetase LanC family protein [Nonomuraea sp. NPDC059007]|uniref:class III lanthionine synthetase LanKC N-terminal domain-containing protein n=1 Tax=Nonomuraea sp. NPDC059007 TaxID=3346692 RepID=UPI00368EC2A7